MALATPLAALSATRLTVAVTLEAVPLTSETSFRMSFRDARSTVATSTAVLARSIRGCTCFTAGSRSSTMPSALLMMGCTCAIASLAERATSSTELRARRMVSASSTTAQMATATRTTRTT